MNNNVRPRVAEAAERMGTAPEPSTKVLEQFVNVIQKERVKSKESIPFKRGLMSTTTNDPTRR